MTALRIIKQICIENLKLTRARCKLIIDENAFFIIITTVYFLVSTFFLTPLKSKNYYNLDYLSYFQSMAVLGFAIVALVYIKEIFRNIGSGYQGLHLATETVFQNYFRLDRLIGFFLLLGASPFFFKAFTLNKFSIMMKKGFTWDLELAKLDLALHGNRHPWEWLHSIMASPVISSWIDKIYYHGWFFVGAVFFSWMAWTKHRKIRKRFFFTFLSCWIFGGTLLAYLFSSAGPCFLKNIYGKYYGYEELFFYLKNVHKEFDLYAMNGQTMLWNSFKKSQLVAGCGISAMPSMHISMMVLYSLSAWHINRIIGAILITISIIFVIGSIHLGWHYAVDGYVSLIMTLFLWWGSGRLIDLKLRFPFNFI